MKKATYVLLCLIICCQSKAQFYKSVLPLPEFSAALEKIVLDFSLNFSTIQCDRISKESESNIYESTVKLPGASECVVYKYHSKADTTASWQGIMYKGDDYKEASKAYENVFRLIKKSKVRRVDKTYAGFNGEMEKPTEALKFTVSTLHIELNDERYKNFEAVVEMVSAYDTWEVHLNLQVKRPDAQQF